MSDLAMFGFTPTESGAYRTLVTLGPSSGYAVARELSIARANAYQALDGLVAKGAAVLVSDVAPKRYRAVQPMTVFARIAAAEMLKLDQLERDLARQPSTGAPLHVSLSGGRAVQEAASRAIVRATNEVLCVAPSEQLQAMVPALRARAAASRPVRVWSADAPPVGMPVDVERAKGTALAEQFGGPVLLLAADGALAAVDRSPWNGVWSEDPLIAGLVRSAIALATGR
jgi:sugar-specific transcriptional regulator TrmB